MPEAGTILKETGRLILLDRVMFSGILIALAVLLAALDAGTSEYAANLYGSLAVFFAGVTINYRMLRVSASDSQAFRPRAAALFGLSLFSGAGILAGSLLLILPGIFLFLRWFVAWPILVDEESSIFASLGKSWQVMRGREFPVLLAVAPLFIPAFAVTFFFFWISSVPGFGGQFLTFFIVNLAIYTAFMTTYVVAVATWRLIAPPSGVEISEA